MTNVVQFGKYKGQPVNRMLSDRDYCSWLSGQKWFRDRYSSVAALSDSALGPSHSCTPEHNAMQNLFLLPKNDHAQLLAEYILRQREPTKTVELNVMKARIAPYTYGEYVNHTYCTSLRRNLSWNKYSLLFPVEREYVEVGSRRGEVGNWDAVINFNAYVNYKIPEIIQMGLRKGITTYPSTRSVWYVPPKLRDDPELDKSKWAEGSPVLNKGFTRNIYSGSAYVELKPSLGDDYPAVLRTVLRRREVTRAQGGRGRAFVIFGKAESSVASQEDIFKVFQQNGICAICLDKLFEDIEF